MQESKLSAVCERVFDRCVAPTAGGEGCDNMTMILIQFKKPANSPAAAADASSGAVGGDQSLSSDDQQSKMDKTSDDQSPSKMDKEASAGTESSSLH